MTRSARNVLQMVFAMAAVLALAAPAAWANHSLKEHLTVGSTGGNANVDVFFDFAAANGSRMFFETPESLVAGDTDATYDLYQRQGSTTTLISTGPTGGNGGLDVFPSDVSSDGTRAFFETDEPLVAADTDQFFDIYERVGTTTNLVSTGPAGGNAGFDAFFHAISDDGTRVFFETEEQLVAGDTDTQADVYERSGGTTTLISAGSPGNAELPALFDGISADGTKVFFETEEQLAAGDTDAFYDVYQRSAGTTTLVSTGPPGGNGNLDATFRGASTDGTRVFFTTSESLSASDTDAQADVYERSGGTTTLVSAPGNGAFAASFQGNSSTGARVFFETREALVAGDTDTSIDVYERSSGTTKLVSAGTPGNGAFDARFAANSADGSRVFFETRESLAGGDTDASFDVYERTGGATTSRLSTGPSGGNGAIDASFAGAALDGTRVFIETAESLAASDTDTVTDLYERYSGITTHISFGSTGGNGPIPSFFSGTTDDGARVYFDTREALMSTDTDTARDVYAADPAGFPRPKGATPVRVSLVPSYRQCTSPNRTHGPPLAFPSCSAPLLQSSQLTIGSPDANGAVANASGFAKYEVIVGAPGGVDDADVAFAFNFSDVRLQGSLADYAGQLQATTQVRISDKLNGPATNEPATGNDVAFPVTASCATTASTTIGSTCSVATSLDAVTPGAVPEGKRSVWQLGAVQVNDGGPDGVVSTTPNTLFATQGVFIP